MLFDSARRNIGQGLPLILETSTKSRAYITILTDSFMYTKYIAQGFSSVQFYAEFAVIHVIAIKSNSCNQNVDFVSTVNWSKAFAAEGLGHWFPTWG